MQKIKKILLLFLVISSISFLFAEKTSFERVYRYKLENGLELFVAENNSAPLAYVEIAIRGGAVTQTPESAGLFHLYEHMMFKGNAKYANERECTEAMNKLGVSDWNGTTGLDRVNYFFTIPAESVYDGLEFWSYAVRTPKMDETELKNEKGVVLAEIMGYYTQPGRILFAGLSKHLFPDYPWQLDSSGIPEVVKHATVEQLKEIQNTYYVPENAAIFVGGDVNHEQILKYVKKIYGDWKNPKTDVPKIKVPTKKPTNNVKKIVYANPNTSPHYINVNYILRGPDGETDQQDTYGADVWSTLLNDPSGFFANSLTEEKSLMIQDSDYTGGYYSTQRASGQIGFYAAMLPNQALTPVKQANEFLKTLRQKTIPKMLQADSFTEDEIKMTVRRMEDAQIYQTETAEGILASLSGIWASCGADYFFDYTKNISKVTQKDIQDFISKYILNDSAILLVSLNPANFEKYKAEFEKDGYEILTQENAYWWGNQKNALTGENK